MKYFAYGSNCNPAIMDKKQVAFHSRERAELIGYRLLFNKRAMRENLPAEIGFANIQPAADHVVEGILYGIDDEHLDRLDRSERFPDHYGRVDVIARTEAGTVNCFTYQAQPDKVAGGLVPSRNYLNHILASRDFLSQQYYEALDKSQVYAGQCNACLRSAEVFFIKEGAGMYTLCQPCREARTIWGDARGRKFTIAETSAVMMHVNSSDSHYHSIADLINDAVDRKLIDP